MDELEFRRSSRCSEGAGCVGVAITAETVHMRDLKEPDGPVLSFESGAWRVFVDAVHAGEFDL